jgi:hypothetical protein
VNHCRCRRIRFLTRVEPFQFPAMVAKIARIPWNPTSQITPIRTNQTQSRSRNQIHRLNLNLNLRNHIPAKALPISRIKAKIFRAPTNEGSHAALMSTDALSDLPNRRARTDPNDGATSCTPMQNISASSSDSFSRDGFYPKMDKPWGSRQYPGEWFNSLPRELVRLIACAQMS